MISCPFCNPGGGGEILRVRISKVNIEVLLCDECDTLWLSEEDIGTERVTSYWRFMEEHHLPPLWSELEVLERGLTQSPSSPTFTLGEIQNFGTCRVIRIYGFELERLALLLETRLLPGRSLDIVVAQDTLIFRVGNGVRFQVGARDTFQRSNDGALLLTLGMDTLTWLVEYLRAIAPSDPDMIDHFHLDPMFTASDAELADVVFERADGAAVRF